MCVEQVASRCGVWMFSVSLTNHLHHRHPYPPCLLQYLAFLPPTRVCLIFGDARTKLALLLSLFICTVCLHVWNKQRHTPVTKIYSFLPQFCLCLCSLPDLHYAAPVVFDWLHWDSGEQVDRGCGHHGYRPGSRTPPAGVWYVKQMKCDLSVMKDQSVFYRSRRHRALRTSPAIGHHRAGQQLPVLPQFPPSFLPPSLPPFLPSFLFFLRRECKK